ncbi:MAG TPA: hypothetical protein VNK92_01755, partial [Vicinamibacterales bacterium]|nr:hypothetical protein [Vicinamibacterales bacterium]
PALLVASHPATPTDPPSGTLDIGGPTALAFQTVPPATGAGTGPGTCVGPNCSAFLLTVGNPGDKDVRVRLDWTLVANDYDLYVFKQGASETQVASSGNGATTFEEAVFTPKASTTYQILIVHFAATADTVHGRVELVDRPTVTQPDRLGPTGTGIVFSPNGNIVTFAGEAPTGRGTLMAPEAARDGEPSVRVDVQGNAYPAAIRGVPAGVDVWRFGPQAYCPRFTFHDDEEFAAGGDPADGYVWLGQPDRIFPDEGEGSPDAGGGDIEIATSFPSTPGVTPTLSMVSLTLANITAAKSTDRGTTWSPANPVAAVAPPADRQWIAAYGDSTVYLYYRTLATLTGLVLQKSIDGGLTYLANPLVLVNPLGLTPGWIDVDKTPNADGSVDIYLSAQNSSELVVFHCVDPSPATASAITCSGRTVDRTMSHGHIFDVVSVDNAGNVYAVWSNNRDIFYAWSADKGASWSNPVQVTASGTGGGMPNTSIFPWITAGDDGRIGIVWYGTDAASHADNDAEWRAYYAFTANARAPRPDLLWTAASDHILHKGNISQAGFNPGETAVNRNLIDFFQVAHDPRDGAAVVAFADDHNDFDGHTYYTRQIAGPGLRAGVSPTSVVCPPLEPLRDPEVVDFAHDEGGTAFALGTVPDADILGIDYGWEESGGVLFLTADVRVREMPVVPVNRSYRAYFAVNTARGLMDTGNEYFIEVSTETVAPEYWLGVTDRRADGTTDERRVERIDADQRPVVFVTGAPGTVRLRVAAPRLDWRFATPGAPVDGGSAPPGVGSLVIGLRGRSRVATDVATSVVDSTRGGSFIVLGREEVIAPPVAIECDDARVTQFGGWHVRSSSAATGGRYCRHVGEGARKDPRFPYVEFQFSGPATVRYDFLTGPRGALVEVFVDGVSQGLVDQYRPADDQSGQKDLQRASRHYAVAAEGTHTFRVEVRTDRRLDPSRNIAYVDGFEVSGGGADGSARSREHVTPIAGTLEPGAHTDHVVAVGLETLLLTAVVEPDDAALFGRETLALEIYAPDGTLVASSIEPVAPEVAVWPGIVPASYVVRVRNVGTAPIGYSGAIVRTQAF